MPVRERIIELRRIRLADSQPIALGSAIVVGSCAVVLITADLDVSFDVVDGLPAPDEPR